MCAKEEKGGASSVKTFITVSKLRTNYCAPSQLTLLLKLDMHVIVLAVSLRGVVM